VKRGSQFQNEEVRKSRPNQSLNMFLDYARSLYKEKQFLEAVSVLGMVSKLYKDLPMESVKNLVDSLLDSYSVQASKVSCYTDPWSCVYCSSVLEDPVTLICGHSCCKKCLLRDITGVCKKCKLKYVPIDEDPIDVEPYIKVSIIISELATKYWARELRSVKLRGEGNILFQRSNVKESIEKYSEAINLFPDDHLSYSNRSNAFFKNNHFEEALEDADKSISLKPDWGKSYFRKGLALAALHRFEEAIVVFFQCFILEENCSKALKMEIVKAMYKLITAKGAETEDVLPSPSSSKAFVKFASHPNLSDTDCTSDGEESVNTENESDSLIAQKSLIITKNKRLSLVLAKIDEAIKEIISTNGQSKPRRNIDPAAVDKDDFDCALCFRLLWEPLTTPCGHTYCRSCLDRSMDHKQECPLCKTSLLGFQKSNTGVNEFVEETIRRMLPGEHLKRQKNNEDELLGADQTNIIPVFVCTLAFPSVPCPLHVFEPRYRLMIRRVMESGARQFGMCIGTRENKYSDYGTMLEIRDIQYFDDGRSVVDTIGGRRFKVLSRDMKDGYNIAKVEWVQDEVLEGEQLENLKSQHNNIRKVAESWVAAMDHETKTGILTHYGEMPGLEHEYWRLGSGPAWCWWVLAIMPLDQNAQQQILVQTQLSKRLEAISRILGFMKRRACS